MPPKRKIQETQPATTEKKKKSTSASAPKMLQCEHQLVIVESPSKCPKIQQILDRRFGAGSYKVVASKGHIYQIPGLRAIDKKTFATSYEVIPGKRGAVNELRAEAARAAGVVLASDDDREGEAISYHLCLELNLDPATTPRTVFHEITESAIVAAFESPRRLDMDLVRAQQTRAVLDMMVGFRVSPLLWKYVGYNALEVTATKKKGAENALSAGRCQIPALRLVADHARERENILGGDGPTLRKKYRVYATCFSDRLPFELRYAPGVPVHEEDNLFTGCSPEDMRTFLEESAGFAHHVLVEHCEPTKHYHSPPLPFNTSRLLQTASSTLHCSAKEVMSLAQTLYQEGLITYHRTTSNKMSGSFLSELKKYAAGRYGGESNLADAEHMAKISGGSGGGGGGGNSGGDSHEAIRPTHISEVELPPKFSGKHKSLYRLIRQQTLQSCLGTAVYEGHKIVVSSPRENYRYEYTVEFPRTLGWKKVTESEAKVAEQTQLFLKYATWLQQCRTEKMTNESMSPRDPLSRCQVHVHSVEAMMTLDTTNLPAAHYSEATLVKKLEDMGIGRPSTFSTIVDTILTRGYVAKSDVPGFSVECRDLSLVVSRGVEDGISEKVEMREFGREKGKLVLQPLGARVLDFCVRHFAEPFSYFYTAAMEDRLDRVARGEESGDVLCRECAAFLKTHISPLAKVGKQAYPLDDRHAVVFTKNGPAIRVLSLSAPPAAAETDIMDAVDADADDSKESPDPAYEYRPIRPGVQLDLFRLAEPGFYKLEDLLALPNEVLGEYEGETMYLKSGRFGLYAQWGEKKASLQNMQRPEGQGIEDITFAQVISFLSAPVVPTSKNVLRIVTPYLSVRKGRFGHYLFYQTADMAKPKMVSLKKYYKQLSGGYMHCPAEELEAIIMLSVG